MIWILIMFIILIIIWIPSFYWYRQPNNSSLNLNGKWNLVGKDHALILSSPSANNHADKFTLDDSFNSNIELKTYSVPGKNGQQLISGTEQYNSDNMKGTVNFTGTVQNNHANCTAQFNENGSTTFINYHISPAMPYKQNGLKIKKGDIVIHGNVYGDGKNRSFIQYMRKTN